MARFALATTMALLLASSAIAQTVIVQDNFDQYADTAAFLTAWPPTHGLGTAPSLPADNQAGILTDDPLSTFDFGPLLQGKAVDHIGALATNPPEIPSASMVNQWGGPIGIGQPGAFQIQPSATQKVFLSYDLYDSAQSGSERMSVGLRKTVTEPDNSNLVSGVGDPDTLPDADTSNILELGFWNANPTVNATNPIFPGAPLNAGGTAVSTQYAFRVINFGAMTGVKQGETVTPHTAQPNWQFFNLPIELDRNADGLVAVSDVGAGWHQYTATISPTEIKLTLDLWRDGLRNTSRDPLTPDGDDRPGTPGVDAEVTLVINTIVTGLGAGFNNLRLGGPSGNSSAAGAGSSQAFDNVILRLLDPVVPVGDADFDQDGDVDGADFLTWQQNLFIQDGSANIEDGDANDDGNVNELDFDVWTDQYGPGAAQVAAAAIPEPATALLAALAMFAGLAITRRR